MKLTEAKIGQKVTFKHRGKMVKGVIIHRHDSQQDPSLRGVVNVSTDTSKFPMTLHISKLKPVVEDIQMEQLLDEKKKHKKKKKFKLLIGKQHRLDVDGDKKIEKSDLKKLRKAKKKGFDKNKDGKTDARDFGNMKESLTAEMMTDIIKGNSVEAQEKFDSLMAEKVTELLNHAKVAVANNVFNTPCSECQDEVNEQQIALPTPPIRRQPTGQRSNSSGSARYNQTTPERNSPDAPQRDSQSGATSGWKTGLALAAIIGAGIKARVPIARGLVNVARGSGRLAGTASTLGRTNIARRVMAPNTPLPASVRQGAVNVYSKNVAPQIATLKQQASIAPTQADFDWARRWGMPNPAFPAGQRAKKAEVFLRQARRLEAPAKEAEAAIRRDMRSSVLTQGLKTIENPVSHLVQSLGRMYGRGMKKGMSTPPQNP